MLLSHKPKPSRAIPGRLGQECRGRRHRFSLRAGRRRQGRFVSVPFMTWCNVPIPQRRWLTSAALGFPIALARHRGLHVISGWSLLRRIARPRSATSYPAGAAMHRGREREHGAAGARVAHSLDVAQLKRVFAFMLYALAA